MKCKGCGAELQHEDEMLPGYIPEEVFEKRTLAGEEVLCQRCFRARHYGKLMPVRFEDFWSQLINVIKEVDVVVWILDITDFEGSYDPKISEMLSSVKKIFVINKIDLLPKAVTVQEIEGWVRRQINEEPLDLILTSATRRYGLRRLEEKILQFRRVLFVGVTNVGKSSLFKALTGKDVSITPFPGTTLGLIRAKVSNTVLLDSPGMTTGHRLIDLLSPESQKKLTPTDHLSRFTFKPDRDSVIFLGGVCRLDIEFDSELRPIFQIFASEAVKFHQTNKVKADTLWRRQYGKLLVPPFDPRELPMESLNFQEKRIELNVSEELAIAGLGWVSVRRGPFETCLKTIDGIYVRKREALINPTRKER
jgi:ribosome biogenesis GTPase YqeH